MPPLDRLNAPPNPFWDFVADMQDHPLFAGAFPQPNQPHQPQDGAAGKSNTDNQNANQNANAADPPEVDPATLREQGREGRRRRRCGGGSSSDEDGERRREWTGGRGWGRHGHPGFAGGPPGPFGPGFGPGRGGHFWGRGGAHPHPPPPTIGGFVPNVHGGRGGPHHHRGHAHGPWGGPWGRRGHGPRGPSPQGGFDLNKFLNDLGDRIGMDLTGAAQGLGLDRFIPNATSPEIDFEPKVDIFDRQQDYIVHVSLPGAKKTDVGVDWDGEHSAIRVAGVVHRPGVDEAMLEQLVVDGRKRENGVFEKLIRLGTRREPATVDIASITAKMTDGVLVVTVPKSPRSHEKREVPIAKSQTPSPARAGDEKQVRFDTNQDDHIMANTEPDHEITLVDLTKDKDEAKPTQPEQARGKQAEAEAESAQQHPRAHEHEQEQEQLPAYNPIDHQRDLRSPTIGAAADDWDNFGSDDEGEYVKINVD